MDGSWCGAHAAAQSVPRRGRVVPCNAACVSQHLRRLQLRVNTHTSKDECLIRANTTAERAAAATPGMHIWKENIIIYDQSTNFSTSHWFTFFHLIFNSMFFFFSEPCSDSIWKRNYNALISRYSGTKLWYSHGNQLQHRIQHSSDEISFSYPISFHLYSSITQLHIYSSSQIPPCAEATDDELPALQFST